MSFPRNTSCAQRQRALSNQLPQLAAHLRTASVKLLRAEYSGWNNEGSWCALRFMDDDYREIHLAMPSNWMTDLCEILGKVLEARYPQWSEGHGSVGDFAWDLARDSLTHVHRFRQALEGASRHEGVVP